MTKKPAKKSKAKQAPPKKAGGSALSRQLANLIDLKKRLKRIQAQAAPLEKKLQDAAEKVIERYTEDDISSVKLKGGTVTRVKQDVPNLVDFAAFFEFIKTHDAPELIHKRVSTEAYRERLANGEVVPGVETFTKVSLQIRLKGEG